MPSEKEIEEIIERIKSGKIMSMDDEDTLIYAYLSMKSERDKYKAIVEADTELLSRLFDIESSERMHNVIEEALALREKES